MTSNPLRIALLLLGAGVSMGLAMPLGKAAIQRGLTPLAFVLWPALVSGLLLALIAWWRHGPPVQTAKLIVFGLIAGLLGNALPNTLVAWLSAAAGSSFSGLAYTLPPVFTLLYLLVLRVQQLNMQRVLAVTLGLVGAAWLAMARFQGGQLSWAAALLLLAIPAVVGAGNVYRALRLPREESIEWLGAALTLGAFALLLPMWLWREAASTTMPSPALPFLAAQVGAAAVGALLFFALQRAAEPVTMSFVGYVMALTAIVVGAVAMGEQLPWQLVPAGALIGTAFWLIARTPVAASPAQ